MNVKIVRQNGEIVEYNEDLRVEITGAPEIIHMFEDQKIAVETPETERTKTSDTNEIKQKKKTILNFSAEEQNKVLEIIREITKIESLKLRKPEKGPYEVIEIMPKNNYWICHLYFYVRNTYIEINLHDWTKKNGTGYYPRNKINSPQELYDPEITAKLKKSAKIIEDKLREQ